MDRDLIYEGQIGLVDNFLNAFKSSMVGIAATSEAVLGQTTQVSGLACTALASTAVTGEAFAVQIGRGFIFSFQETDPNSYGLLGTDTTTSILKTGINLSATNLGLANAAPSTAGFSVNYLISAGFQETDTNQQSIPFYNGTASPTEQLQNGTRTQRVVLQVTGGAAAATGTQATPSAPSGYVPLWVVTVTNGDTAVVSGRIALAPGAPVVTTLPTISPKAVPLAGASTVSSASLNGFWEISGSSTYTTTIPSPVGVPGQWAVIFNASSVAQTLSTPGGVFFGPGGGGGATLSLAAGVLTRIYSDGTNWIVDYGPVLLSKLQILGTYYRSNNFNSSAATLSCSTTFTAPASGVLEVIITSDASSPISSLSLGATGGTVDFYDNSVPTNSSGGVGIGIGTVSVSAGASVTLTASSTQTTASGLNITLNAKYIQVS